jgi:undecaprenyl-diphosphatase
MLISHAIILGIVQGLTEALPISSSAHLVIVPWLFNWHYQGLSFDIALHFGTALAFGLYFFKDWIEIIGSAFTKESARKSNMLWYIMIGTIPGAIAGLVLEKKAETVFRSITVIAATLFVFGIILFIADRIGKRQKTMKDVNLKSCVIIGLAQMLAIVPGVSRSGITITAGLFEGFTREAAARFSFLLATPIVFAAAVLKLPKLHAADFNTAFWAGVMASAVSGFFGIHFLLKFVKKANLNIFVLYRVAFAIIMVALVIAK